MLNVEPDPLASIKEFKAAPAVYEHVVWPYRFALLLMNAIAAYVAVKKRALSACQRKPRVNFFFFDGLSINSRRMKEGATRWPSLDTCYNFTHGEGTTVLHRALDAWWMRIRNAQAVRNRLIIAKMELSRAILAAARSDKPVRILSLAAGTAQGVIESAAQCKTLGVTTEVVLVDHDRSALRYASDLAHRHGIVVKAIEGNVLFFTRYIDGFQADIVEMIGFLDYLGDGLATALLKKVRRYLRSGGHFFCCHIHRNGEAGFLKHVVDWDNGMLYRSRQAFENLLITAGFAEARFVTEPHSIHTVSIAEIP